MFERLTEVKDCLERLSAHHAHPQLVQLQQGLLAALQMAQTDYTLLRQAADWLEHIADLLDPAEKPLRSADQVQKTLFGYLETIQTISDKPASPTPSPRPVFCRHPRLSYQQRRESDSATNRRPFVRRGLTCRIIQRRGLGIAHRPAFTRYTPIASRPIRKNDNEFSSTVIVSDCIPVLQNAHLQLAKLEQRWANSRLSDQSKLCRTLFVTAHAFAG